MVKDHRHFKGGRKKTPCLGAMGRQWSVARRQVLDATNHAKDFQPWGDSHGPQDTLVANIVMPERNGGEFADWLRGERLSAYVHLALEYSSKVLHARGHLDEGARFVEKPYSTRVVAAAIRSRLDSSTTSG